MTCQYDGVITLITCGDCCHFDKGICFMSGHIDIEPTLKVEKNENACDSFSETD